MKASEKRDYGAFYTPDVLADYLLSRCPGVGVHRILDPACGEFALLKAAQKRYQSDKICYIGCDKRGMKSLEPNLKFVKSDFFEYEERKRFDLIVENPPYIKSNRRGDKCDKWVKKLAYESEISKRADMWVFFLYKSIRHLRSGGSLAAILPWAFFQANYSSTIRRDLLKDFRTVHVQVLTKSYFPDTNQKVILLWLFGKGESNKEIRICVSNELRNGARARFVAVDKNIWGAGFGVRLLGVEQSLSCPDVKQMGDLCDIKIGLVTGATTFFIKTTEQLKDSNISELDCRHIVTSARDVEALSLHKTMGLKWLVAIGRNKSKKYRKMIEDGERSLFNERRHCKNRKCWYCIEVPKRAPDAFFSYRSSSVPLFTLNRLGVWCTNSLHAVFFRTDEVSKNQVKWIQISLLSAFSLADIELFAKTYGKDVLKIEPTALKKVRVYCPNKKIDAKIYSAIKRLVEKGEKNKAVIVATEYLFDEMKLSARDRKGIITRYNRLREQRTGKRLNFEREI